MTAETIFQEAASAAGYKDVQVEVDRTSKRLNYRHTLRWARRSKEWIQIKIPDFVAEMPEEFQKELQIGLFDRIEGEKVEYSHGLAKYIEDHPSQYMLDRKKMKAIE